MITKLALAALLLGAQPASACHRFAVWRYPTPQRCAVTHVAFHPPSVDKSYYVEVTTPPPIPLPKVEPVAPKREAPLEMDLRTPDEIKDFDEHQDALVKHHDEINKLMILLHVQEDARHAAGAE